jgi:hypothetical protein
MVRRLLLLLAALAAIAAMSPSNVAAYGGRPANWQLTFAATGTLPGSGFGFGFWGWCELSGAADRAAPTSGTEGDCQYAAYFHAPSARQTCHASINITSWAEEPSFIGSAFGVPNDLVVLAGSQTPPSTTGPCAFSTSSPFDLAPAKAGHYNGNAFVPFLFAPATTGEIQIQVTQVP